MKHAQPSDHALVLVVEDDELLAQMYRLRLEAAGLAVQVAHDAEAAWSLLQTTQPQVMLLDILLPRVNGLQILKDLRGHARWHSLPVIILTNLNRVEVELTPELAEMLGVTAYLVKSQTSPDVVVDWVKKALNQSPETQ